MSIFDTVNPSAERGDEASVAYAPTAGFFDGFNMAYEAHVRASSMSGLEHAFESADEEQAQAWGNVHDGGRVPRLRDVAGYEALASYFVDGEGLEPWQVQALKDYDAAAARANKEGAKVRPAKDIFSNVQKLAQRAERDVSMTPTTGLGDVGQFLGSTLASMDPRTDLFNFLTLPVGGAGKTVAARVGSQVGAQGVIETVNQLTGVQENRRLLGLDHGFAQGATQVIATAAGAGVLQGFGEGALALGRAANRRWFSQPGERVGVDSPDTATEIPPPPPPPRTADTRGLDAMVKDYQRDVLERSPWKGPPSASARATSDLDAVTAQLDDWDGPKPWQMEPVARTDTAVGRVLGAGEGALDVSVKPGAVDTIAREIDPHTFREYDGLAKQKETIRTQIDRLQDDKANLAQEALDDLSDEIVRLKAKQAGENRRKAKITGKRIAEVEAEREAGLALALSRDTTELRFAREYMMQLDYKMRDLAPLITRAYTKARNRWAPHEEELNGVVSMIRKASSRRAEAESVASSDPVAYADVAPVARMLASHPEVRASAKPGDDAADLVGRAVAAEAEALSRMVEDYRQAAEALQVEGDKLTLSGVDHTFDMDEKIAWPLDDEGGFQELSIRDILERSRRDELELQSVTVCSTRKAS